MLICPERGVRSSKAEKSFTKIIFAAVENFGQLILNQNQFILFVIKKTLL